MITPQVVLFIISIYFRGSSGANSFIDHHHTYSHPQNLKNLNWSRVLHSTSDYIYYVTYMTDSEESSPSTFPRCKSHSPRNEYFCANSIFCSSLISWYDKANPPNLNPHTSIPLHPVSNWNPSDMFFLVSWTTHSRTHNTPTQPHRTMCKI